MEKNMTHNVYPLAATPPPSIRYPCPTPSCNAIIGAPFRNADYKRDCKRSSLKSLRGHDCNPLAVPSTPLSDTQLVQGATLRANFNPFNVWTIKGNAGLKLQRKVL